MRPLFFVLVVLVFFPAYAIAGQIIHIATADGPPLSKPDNTGMHDLIMQEAFSRIGYDLQIVHLPAERAMINANEGIEDGVYVRIAGLEKLYPNLHRVSEKITDYEFVAFTKKIDAATTDWTALRPYDVGIIRGWKILEMNIRDTKSLTKVNTPVLLFTLLQNDRVDLVVYNRLDGYGVMRDLGLEGITTLEPPLAVRAMFLYLHDSRRHLAPKLAAALQEMKQDGTYAAIANQVLSDYAPKEAR